MIFADTDVMIDVLRGHPPAVGWLKMLRSTPVVISGFVCAELLQGCANKTEQTKVLSFLSHYEVRWPDASTCERSLILFAEYGLTHGLGILDAIIAQTAIDSQLPLCTFNAKHYSCVPGLKTLAPYPR